MKALRRKLRLWWLRRKPLPEGFTKTAAQVYERRQQLFNKYIELDKAVKNGRNQYEPEVKALQLAVMQLDWLLPSGLSGNMHEEKK